MKKNNFVFRSLLAEKKYRPILISVLFFLTFDLGVLIPNLFFSTALKKDAISINLAGRQRMLSQRMTKSLLQVKSAQERGDSIKKNQEELKKTYELFDSTLEAFQKGKEVKGGGRELVFLDPVETQKGKDILKKALTIWNPYKEKLQPIINADKIIQFQELEAGVKYANENNLLLLSLMNDLTSEAEKVADRKAGYLQAIQLVGMALALGNFFLLLSRSLRRLKESDNQLQEANAEILQLNSRLQSENSRMSSELETTKRLQQMILPKSSELTSVEGLDIAGFMEPADEVGGDYYDVLNNNGSIKIGIGDVTGHGLESGMLMLMVQTAVRTLQEINENDPVKFMDVLNRTIYKNIQRMDSGKNLTLSLIDYDQGQLSLSGQHEELILVRSSGEIEIIDTSELGFPIGLDEEIADFVSQQKVCLNLGDTAILFTDGITESEDIDGNLYGLDRLCEVVKENHLLSAMEIKEAVISDVRKHIGKQQVFDDITLLVLKQTGNKSSSKSTTSEDLEAVGS
ncbi:MAG: SpoIIE family protein phosphatase [Cyanobacteria bacterium P01_A01_bin.45]